MLQLATLGAVETPHLALLQHSYSWKAIQNSWMMLLYFSHIRCYLFLHTIVYIFFTFSLLDITNSRHCKSRMCPQCAGYGWPRPYQPTLRLISRARHKQNGDFSLRPSAGTSKNVDTTFKHWDWNIKWTPAWWGRNLSGVRTFVKSRRKMKIIFSSLSRSSTNNTLNKSISDVRTSYSLLLMSISRDTWHGHAEEQWQIKVSGSFLLIRNYYFGIPQGSATRRWYTCTLVPFLLFCSGSVLHILMLILDSIR